MNKFIPVPEGISETTQNIIGRESIQIKFQEGGLLERVAGLWIGKNEGMDKPILEEWQNFPRRETILQEVGALLDLNPGGRNSPKYSAAVNIGATLDKEERTVPGFWVDVEAWTWRD